MKDEGQAEVAVNSVDIEEQTRDLCGCRIDTEGYGLRRMLTYPAKSE